MSWFWNRAPRNAIDPYVVEFKAYMEQQGLPVRIGEVRRSYDRQRWLYAQGRTRPGPVVTWTLDSKHLRGRAFDFDFISALDQADYGAWEFAGQVGEWLGLRWGGRWSSEDLRHLELPD
jgi:peptidoglycan L-alanyl-D-glutamate endopeptidase CwlK